MKHAEVAGDFQKWSKCFDINGRMTEAEFDSLTMEQRIAIMDGALGDGQEPHPEPCYNCGAMCAERTCD